MKIVSLTRDSAGTVVSIMPTRRRAAHPRTASRRLAMWDAKMRARATAV